MNNKKLKIDFWDVGQGDASVVHLPDSSLIVIDTGPLGSPLYEWFAREPRHVTNFLITHNDSDHIGCLASILELSKKGMLSFEKIGIVSDRGFDHPTVKKLWSQLRQYESKMTPLGQGQTIWEDENLGLSLQVVHPSPLTTIRLKAANQKSAILVLYHSGLPKVVFPGDAKFRSIKEKFADSRIEYLLGPHHGRPEDRSPQKTFDKFKSNVESTSVDNLLISVGTDNSHGHPDKDYLQIMAKKPCRVSCTQLTPQCDEAVASSGVPVFDGTQALGLEPSQSGTPCRGCFQLVWDSKKNQLVPHTSHVKKHAEGIQMLKSPMCVAEDLKG